jgi:hypothetical protein
MRKTAGLVDRATRELAHIHGFSGDERDVIMTLISNPTTRRHSVDDAYATVLREIGARDFQWPEFDRWYTVFANRGLFPPLWEGLERRPGPNAPLSIRRTYQERKLYLLLDWLHGLMATRAEMRAALARYAVRGIAAQIARQRADVTCPACDPLNHEDVNRRSPHVPPFHPGCRCLILAHRADGADLT